MSNNRAKQPMFAIFNLSAPVFELKTAYNTNKFPLEQYR
jgi:hypothetical protein